MISFLYEVNRLRPQDGHQLSHCLALIQSRKVARQTDGHGYHPGNGGCTCKACANERSSLCAGVLC